MVLRRPIECTRLFSHVARILLSVSELAMMRSLTTGERWKDPHVFLVLNCGCSRQLPTRSSSRPSFDGNSSCPHPFICVAIKGVDPVLTPDPEFHGPVARSTLSFSSVRPLPHSKLPPTLPMSPAARYTQREPWAESKCLAQIAAADSQRPRALALLLPSPLDRRVQHSPDGSKTASGTQRMVPLHSRFARTFQSRLRRLRVQRVSPSTRTPSPPAPGIRGELQLPIWWRNRSRSAAMPLSQARLRRRECDRCLVSAAKAEPLGAPGPCRGSSHRKGRGSARRSLPPLPQTNLRPHC